MGFGVDAGPSLWLHILVILLTLHFATLLALSLDQQQETPAVPGLISTQEKRKRRERGSFLKFR